MLAIALYVFVDFTVFRRTLLLWIYPSLLWLALAISLYFSLYHEKIPLGYPTQETTAFDEHWKSSQGGALAACLISLMLWLVGYVFFPRWTLHSPVYTRWFSEFSYLFALVASFFSLSLTQGFLTRSLFIFTLLRPLWSLLLARFSNDRSNNNEKKNDNNTKKEGRGDIQAAYLFGLGLVHGVVQEALCMGSAKTACYGPATVDSLGIAFLLCGLAVGIWLVYNNYNKNSNRIRHILYISNVVVILVGCWLLMVNDFSLINTISIYLLIFQFSRDNYQLLVYGVVLYIISHH